MKTKYLLPHYLKLPGWIILVIGSLIMFYLINTEDDSFLRVNMPAIHSHFPNDIHKSGFFIIINNQIADEIAYTLIIVGSLFIALSKEKIEDEFMMKLRLESLLWAVIVNSVIMILCLYFFYGYSFLITIFFNVVSVLLLFVVKFKFELRKAGRYDQQP
jgi:hypothetical protein